MMILADTSVWIDHLRRGNAFLASHLEEGNVATHPLIIGELACGQLPHRDEVLARLGDLPQVPVATHDEAMAFLERRRLMGRGLGFIDVHLLASVALAGDVALWTLDNRLAAVQL